VQNFTLRLPALNVLSQKIAYFSPTGDEQKAERVKEEALFGQTEQRRSSNANNKDNAGNSHSD
jgi:hypothetical protein